MRIILALLFITTFFAAVSYSQTIQVEFTRIADRKNRKEIAKGKIYYDGTKTTLKVYEPLNQWMILDASSVLIYYPDHKQAIKINSNNPTTLSFFQVFIGIVKEDFGLSQLGYTVRESKFKGDTLFVYWNPPKITAKIISEFILGLYRDKIVFTEAKGTDGNAIGRTTFHNYLTYGAMHFPLEMKMMKFAENDTTIEEIVYFNPIIDQPLPAEVVNFAVPPEIKVEEMAW